MGLSNEERAAAKNLSADACYGAIHEWMSSAGMAFAKNRTDGYHAQLRRLAAALPPVSSASKADKCFVFVNVISNKLEGAYHEADGKGTKMAAYAFQGLEDLGCPFGSEEAYALAVTSVLTTIS